MPRPARPSSVLGRLLEAAGYRLDPRPEGVLAVRAKDRRAVLIVAAPRSPADVEGLFPTDAVHRTIVYDDEPGTVARALAADRSMEVLEPSTLGAALGELLLPAPPGPLESVDDDFATDGPGLPFPVAPDGERTVRPRIDRAEAEVVAGIDASQFTLRLVPYFVGAYRVRPPSPHGESGPVVRRLVAVNAISRGAEIWEDGDRELVRGVADPHQRLPPQLTEPQARSAAVEAIRRHHTVHVDHTEQHGGALVIETRRIPPSPDDLQVGPLVLLYVPHWYAESGDGRVVVDAVTGRRAALADP
ncbi:MAG TPA: hypothetical protein VMG81_00180 [Thermoplasmata archaeon]|nr:hypothetical protein [Thermoplasmata archaeon]